MIFFVMLYITYMLYICYNVIYMLHMLYIILNYIYYTGCPIREGPNEK